MLKKMMEQKMYLKKTEHGADVDSNIAILETGNTNYKIKIDNTEGTVYSIIDNNDNQLTEKKYSYLEYLKDDKFIASINGILGVIDPKGNQIIEIKHDSLEKLQGTECLTSTITENSTTQIYDKDLNKLCDIENANIEVNDNYIKIYNQNETKYFTLEGKEIKNTDLLTNNKIFATSKDGKWGFVDKNGNVVIDYIYDKTTDLNSYGYAGIELNGKWGVVNQDGKIILEPKYELNSQTEPEFLGQYYKVKYNYGEFYFTN